MPLNCKKGVTTETHVAGVKYASIWAKGRMFDDCVCVCVIRPDMTTTSW